MNTADFLNIATAICPDKAAIVFEDKRYTFSQLNERVNRLANGLIKLGVQKGDRVASIQGEVKSLKHLISLEKKHEGMLYYEDIIKSSPADEVVAEIGDRDTTILM